MMMKFPNFHCLFILTKKLNFLEFWGELSVNYVGRFDINNNKEFKFGSKENSISDEHEKFFFTFLNQIHDLNFPKNLKNYLKFFFEVYHFIFLYDL